MAKRRGRPHNQRAIHVADEVPGDEVTVSFSFRYLRSDPKFLLTDCTCQFFTALMEKMRYYGEMKMKHFTMEDDKEKRHEIVWANTNEEGFPYDPAEVNSDSPWQFGLISESDPACRWRVHGFLLETTFFVVWLDFNHSLVQGDKNKRK